MGRPGSYAFLSAISISAGWYLGLVPDGVVETLGVILILLGVLDLDIWEAAIGVRAPFNLRLGLIATLALLALALVNRWTAWYYLSLVLAIGFVLLGTAYTIAHSDHSSHLAPLAKRWHHTWPEEEKRKRMGLGWGLVELSSQEALETTLSVLILLPVFFAIFYGLSLEFVLLSGPVGVFFLGGVGVVGLAKVESWSKLRMPSLGSKGEGEDYRSGVLEVFLENAYRFPIFVLSLWVGFLGVAMVRNAWVAGSNVLSDTEGFVSAVDNGLTALTFLGIALVIGLAIHYTLSQSKKESWGNAAYLGLFLQTAALSIIVRLEISLKQFSRQTLEGMNLVGIHLVEGRMVFEVFFLPAWMEVLHDWDATRLLSFLAMATGVGVFLLGEKRARERRVWGIPLPLLAVSIFSILLGFTIDPALELFLIPVVVIASIPIFEAVSPLLTGGRIGEGWQREVLDACIFFILLFGSFLSIYSLIEGGRVATSVYLLGIGFVFLIKLYPPVVIRPARILLGVKIVDESAGGEDDGVENTR